MTRRSTGFTEMNMAEFKRLCNMLRQLERDEPYTQEETAPIIAAAPTTNHKDSPDGHSDT